MNRSVLTLVAGVLACCTLAACGSSTSSSSASAAAAGTSARSKLVACLKAHGVTLPARPGGFRGGGAGSGGGGGAPGGRPPGGGGGGGFFGGGGGGGRFRSNPKSQAAFKACGQSFRGRRFNGASRKVAIENFVKCVRQHGYNLPQPNFSGQGPVFPAKIAKQAKFRTASRFCLRALRPPPPSGAPASGAPPST
jgi:hypothetical protein